jgi:signal peptidase I
MKKIIIAIVAIIVAVALISLYLFMPLLLYDGSMVMQGSSMCHSIDHRQNGIIDENDIVYYNIISGQDEIISYVEGESTDYSRYGSYGDVIIYRPNGLTQRQDGSEVIPIIHRAIVWIEVNTSRINPSFNGIDYQNYSFDVPSLGRYNTTEKIEAGGALIELNKQSGILNYYQYMNTEPHGGFITMGDYNTPYYDQPMSGSFEPILPDWIIGKVVHLKDR